MKKRILAISDIHGCHQEFNALLNKIKFNPEDDQLILLGDYVDRGLKSKQVVEQVMQLVNEHGAIALKGNHDDMMINAFKNNHGESSNDVNWINNGALTAIESYVGYDWFTNGFDWDEYEKAKKFIVQNYHEHLNFLRNLPYYYETDTHIFVHAGINPFYEDWKYTSKKDLIWIRELFYQNPITNTDKTVVFGHTPTLYLTSEEGIWYSPHGDKIGIDGGCSMGGKLNCLILNENGYDYEFIKKGQFF